VVQDGDDAEFGAGGPNDAERVAVDVGVVGEHVEFGGLIVLDDIGVVDSRWCVVDGSDGDGHGGRGGFATRVLHGAGELVEAVEVGVGFVAQGVLVGGRGGDTAVAGARPLHDDQFVVLGVPIVVGDGVEVDVAVLLDVPLVVLGHGWLVGDRDGDCG
jgi:hypothetical protein